MADSEEDIYASPLDELTLSSGLVVCADLNSVYETADFFASQYGIGGFRSLDDYVDMVANTSVETIRRLQRAAVKRIKIENGVKQEEEDGDDTPEAIRRLNNLHIPPSHRTHRFAGDCGQGGLKQMLRQFGVDPKEIDKKLEEVKNRQISFGDYSDVTKESLENMSKKEFENLYAQMQRDAKNSAHFVVTDEMLRENLKRRGG